jgi:AmiR/NasT family two-component response regulator
MTDGLQSSLHTRDLVNRACGILMERSGINHQEALQQLIREARASNSRLQDVSESILAGTPAGRE